LSGPGFALFASRLTDPLAPVLEFRRPTRVDLDQRPVKTRASRRVLHQTRMIDEIQQVLEAQARAQADVDAARARGTAELGAAGVRTRAIRERNAQRALRAIRTYETRCAEKVARATEALETEAGRAEQEFRDTLRERLDGLVRGAFARLWPD